MKTAQKVIKDRIEILDNVFEKTKNNTSDQANMAREQIIKVRGLFDQIQKTIDGYLSLREDGQHSEDYSEAIKELTGQTIIPLIERSNEQIESFKNMEEGLRYKLNEIDITEQELKKLSESLNFYKEAIESTINFRNECQVALEEIKELLIAEEVEEIAEMTHEDLSPFSAPNPQEEEEDEVIEEKDSQEIYDNKQDDNTPNERFNDHSEDNNNQKPDNEFPI
jgi:hypothetical protein